MSCDKPKCTCTLCTCTVNKKLDEFDQNLQLSQFLIGLNDSFTGIRGQILPMTHLPSLNQSYGMLLQEEKQRESYDVNSTSENMAMDVKSHSHINPQSIKNQSVGGRKNDAVVCDYFHMSGHMRDKCYCIHGYPTRHKLFGKPKPKPKFLKERNSVVASVNTHASLDSMHSGTGYQPGTATETLYLSEGKCRQLIQMLQKNMLELQMHSPSIIPSMGSHLNATPWTSQPSINTVQLAGMAGHFVSHVHSAELCQSRLIVDTGATDHITHFLHLLSNVQSCYATLQLPNGASAIITHVEKLALTPQLKLSNVFCVPSFTYNLLSVSKLLKVTSHQVHFLADMYYIQDPTW